LASKWLARQISESTEIYGRIDARNDAKSGYPRPLSGANHFTPTRPALTLAYPANPPSAWLFQIGDLSQ
jgi:hypothetical protein